MTTAYCDPTDAVLGGMERVVCVSHAKVPIVKIWDPELQLACDMNVNNTLALENTRMIRTYVDIDERVRPLAMTIKHWTKRRILNDAGSLPIQLLIALRMETNMTAALGGTLSSYTWICLIVNFLQTRSPPILPSLQRNHKQQRAADGTPITFFDDDLDRLAGFGRDNKSTLGKLLFQFFRYYGHELEYEKYVMSVREGILIPKESKGWHLLQNNRLCVEEPFNTSRNLGNTADDTSFRGVHMEIRRAFSVLSEGNFEECCAQYEYPPEEERNFERPPPQPRPIIAPTPPMSSRGGRGGRGGRHPSQYNRGPNTGRRASSAANRPSNSRHANPSLAAEIALQAQQAQYLLHDQLYQQIQVLQAQEQELRMQLQNQSLISGRPMPTLIRQPYLQFPFPQQQETNGGDENSRSRAGTVNHPPLTAPVRQPVLYNPNLLPVAVPPIQTTSTNPPSPSVPSAGAEVRRSHRRSSASNTSPRGPARAQSQPARTVPSSVPSNFSGAYSSVIPGEGASNQNVRESPRKSGGEAEMFLPNGVPLFSKPGYVPEGQPTEYVGYYVGDSAQPQVGRSSSLVSPLSVSTGLAIQNGGTTLSRNSPEHSSNRAYHERSSNSPETPYVSSPTVSPLPRNSTRTKPQNTGGPLIVDGSVPPSEQRSIQTDINHNLMPVSPSLSVSEDRLYNTPGSISDYPSHDMQDSSSYDDEYLVPYERNHSDLHKSPRVNGNILERNINGHTVNGHFGRLENLSEQLRRFQFADVTAPTDFSAKKQNLHHKDTNGYLLANDDNIRDSERHEQVSKATQFQPKGGHLSGKETRTETSHNKFSQNGLSGEKSSNTNHKPKFKGRQEPANQTNSSAVPTAEKKDKKPDSQRKPNGIPSVNGTIGSHHNVPNYTYNNNHSTWQTTTKKKHKKGAKDSTEQNRSTVNGAEPLPADETLRKGG